MTLIPYMQRLLDEALKEVHQYPDHDLRIVRRLKIYDTLEFDVDTTDFSEPYFSEEKPWLQSRLFRRYARLGIATAQYVLPVWDSAIPSILAYDRTYPIRLPIRMLRLAKRVLENKATAQDADKILNRAYFASGGFPFFVNYNTSEAFRAAEIALAEAVGNLAILFDIPPQYIADPNAPDHKLYFDHPDYPGMKVRPRSLDVAFLAAQAYSAIDHDPIGSDERTPITYDADKRLAYWDWWLSSAVPAICTKVQ